MQLKDIKDYVLKKTNHPFNTELENNIYEDILEKLDTLEEFRLDKIKTLAEIAKESGISAETLRYRLKFLDSSDYRVMGVRKDTLLTPNGAEEILKERG